MEVLIGQIRLIGWFFLTLFQEMAGIVNEAKVKIQYTIPTDIYLQK
jgi:hypothetical protein